MKEIGDHDPQRGANRRKRRSPEEIDPGDLHQRVKIRIEVALSSGVGWTGYGYRDHRRPSEVTASKRLEFDRRRFANSRALFAEIEEILWREAERGGEQSGGKTLDPGIVFLNGFVEEPPRSGDLVLQIRQLSLQLLEIRAGLQVGISLGQGEELP